MFNDENILERMFDEDNSYFEEHQTKIAISKFWSEKICVFTEDYEIKGFVFMPKTGKKNRILSDILNGEKRFVAIKDAEIKHRHHPDWEMEHQEFIHINLDSIVLIRPEKDS
jgi:hypothetical protein